MKNFPISAEKILPAALVLGTGALGCAILGFVSGCHTATDSVEASTTRDPVVAPAGTVLRVRLNQTLDTERSRPGDRFSGVLDSAVMAGRTEVLPKGTAVEGRVLDARESGAAQERAVLAVTLDSFEREGRKIALETNTVTRTSGAHNKPNWTIVGEGSSREAYMGSGAASGAAGAAVAGKKRVTVPAETIIGFTLKSTLSA